MHDSAGLLSEAAKARLKDLEGDAAASFGFVANPVDLVGIGSGLFAKAVLAEGVNHAGRVAVTV